MVKLSPSLFAADFAHLADEVAKVENAGAEYLHIDVMDGNFVPNMSLGPQLVKAIRKDSKMVFDVHLMVTRPERYVEAFAKAGADIISIHWEATANINAALEQIRALGVKPAIVIKPKTDPKVIKYLIEQKKVDLVLVMSVEPGFGGQSFMPESLDKVRAIRAWIDEFHPECDLEIDGGISLKNAAEVVKAGANVLVAGSAVYNAEDVPATVRAFKEVANG